jgi:plastocyanin
MKTFRSALVLPLAMLAVAGTVGFRSAGAAGGSLVGTVKATGLSSNADAVVYLVQAPGTFTATTANMDQKQMQFIPHVLPVLIGTTVKFLNSDPTPHNVFSGDYEKFNLGTWPQGQTKDHAFDKCAKFPCVYTALCRVHAEMEGFVVVLQNPFFAVSGKDGRYAIENIPPGKYDVGIWHPKLKGQGKPVTVQAGAPVTFDFVLAR